MTVAPPPPPSSLPEISDGEPSPSSRYRRRRPLRVISWTGLLLGFAFGVGLGLYYTWNINPIVEVSTRPRQLADADRNQYLAAIALSFSYNGDLNAATERLIDTTAGRTDPFQLMADAACDLTRTGYANTGSGIRAIRAMKTFYQLQGRTGCADELILANNAPTREVVVVLPTPTDLPPATKTPTQPPPPTATRAQPTVVIPTAVPVQQFIVVNVSTYCNPERSGLIEVYVQDFNGQGIPGERIRVRWDTGEDQFVSGLHPARGAAYADFEMEAGIGYTIEMPGRSDPYSQALVAAPCTTEFGQGALTSYRVTFRSN